ncbi:TPR repeat protein [Sporothrix schenckii 1099-18]|uniref:TPR repeat protein n=1 Tax=Sporothrix schenckii 1099-18 TaxID=1397361 RepID=A0A0F2M9R7_SPOSC|nr:TPR repeat protein [Sporothrix schenckii 1099-18]KJR85834.1 TPR repeat protein [Sporothrix schenckii 1099-18]
MVQLKEISDEVAEKLKLGETSPATDNDGKVKKAEAQPAPAPSTAPAPAPAASTSRPAQDAASEPTVAGPELPPARALTSGKTADEILAELNKSPLFMTDLEDNDDIAALQALAYEGTPFENAGDFKERGNECFRESKWADAREFYGKGIALLAAEDKRRARGEAPKLEADEDGKLPDDPDTPDQVAQQHALLAQLYGNRAACQLELRNYRSCTLDCGCALRLNSANTKAWFRSAKALLALDKTDEADEACAGGLAVDPQNASLLRLSKDIAARAEMVAARKRREDERVARETRKKQRLRAVLRLRGVRTRTTAQPPEMEDAAVRLEPEDDGTYDLDVSKSTVSYPTVLLYPLKLQSDFIKAFNETESLGDHLAYILPVPWDTTAKDYAAPAGVDCYMETIAGSLVKVGKKMALGKILAQASVEVVDEVVRVFVVPREQAESWVREFKEKKAAERGEQTEK